MRSNLFYYFTFVLYCIGLTSCGVSETAANDPSNSTPMIAPTQKIEATTSPAPPPEAAWVEARADLPAEVPIYRPTWLPERFAEPPVLDYVRDQGGETGVTYRIAYRNSAGEMIHFALGPVNSARPEASESIQVLNQDGTLSTTSGWPTFDMIWTEDQRVYSIQANGADVTREEMLQIAEGLQIVE